MFLNGASHDTKIGCIRLAWAGSKKNHKFSFLLCAGPLRGEVKTVVVLGGAPERDSWTFIDLYRQGRTHKFTAPGR